MEGYYSIKGFLVPSSSVSRHKRNHNNKSRMHRHRELISFRNQESTQDGVGGVGSYFYNLEKRKAFSRMRRTAQEMAQQQLSENVTQDFYSIESSRARRETMGCNINHNTNRRLYIGCNENTVIEVKPKCKNDEEETYTCHGHWQENQTTFIIAKHLSSQHGVCISYVPTEGIQVQLYVGDSCHRPGMQGPGGGGAAGGGGGGGNGGGAGGGASTALGASGGSYGGGNGGVAISHMTLSNVTVLGKCGETSTSITLHYRHNSSWMILTVLSIMLFNFTLR